MTDRNKLMANKDPRWEPSNPAHILTFDFLKQTYNDDGNTILAIRAKLNTLKYFNATDPDDKTEAEQRGFDAAAKLIRFAHLRGIKFGKGRSRESALQIFYGILKDGSKEVIALAHAVDKQYLFAKQLRPA